jgi:hypothetical protein
MKRNPILIAAIACAMTTAVFGITAAALAAQKPPKAKDYRYCATVPKEGGGGTEHECFENEPFEVFKKTKTFKFGNTTGTYTQNGKEVVFHESAASENHGADELRGTRGKKHVISGTLYENGAPTETTFTLTPIA